MTFWNPEAFFTIILLSILLMGHSLCYSIVDIIAVVTGTCVSFGRGGDREPIRV